MSVKRITVRETGRLPRKLHIEAVVKDIAMPLPDGVEATRQILNALPAGKVLFLSAHDEDESPDGEGTAQEEKGRPEFA